MKKYYVYIIGMKVPYIIQANTEQEIWDSWKDDKDETISFINKELEPGDFK